MPPKPRILKKRLQEAGFSQRPGKGNHTVWKHPLLPHFRVVLAGNDGDEASKYQLKDILHALKQIEARA